MFKIIYKEAGISSFKAIRNFARENNIKKIGHTGTLDPMASGLLLVATDDDTKLIDYITNKDKIYLAEATFNVETDTYDSEGSVVKEYNKTINLEMIEKIIPKFIGKISQIPPIFSAKKINGKKAYEYARKKQEITLKASIVEIYHLDILSFEKNILTFEVAVSNGTYIRSLIHDIGKALQTGAHMSKLERTVVHGLDKNKKDLDYRDLIDLPFIENNEFDLTSLINGKDISIQRNDGKYGIISANKSDIIGIIEIKNNKILNRKIFGNKLEKKYV